MSDSKIPDAQAGYEKGVTLALAALAGCNRVCEAGGMLGSLMGCSFESLYLDNEAIGMILRTVRGIEVTDETMGEPRPDPEATSRIGRYLIRRELGWWVNSRMVWQSKRLCFVIAEFRFRMRFWR